MPDTYGPIYVVRFLADPTGYIVAAADVDEYMARRQAVPSGGWVDALAGIQPEPLRVNLALAYVIEGPRLRGPHPNERIDRCPG